MPTSGPKTCIPAMASNMLEEGMWQKLQDKSSNVSELLRGIMKAYNAFVSKTNRIVPLSELVPNTVYGVLNESHGSAQKITTDQWKIVFPYFKNSSAHSKLDGFEKVNVQWVPLNEKYAMNRYSTITGSKEVSLDTLQNGNINDLQGDNNSHVDSCITVYAVHVSEKNNITEQTRNNLVKVYNDNSETKKLTKEYVDSVETMYYLVFVVNYSASKPIELKAPHNSINVYDILYTGSIHIQLQSSSEKSVDTIAKRSDQLTNSKFNTWVIDIIDDRNACSDKLVSIINRIRETYKLDNFASFVTNNNAKCINKKTAAGSSVFTGEIVYTFSPPMYELMVGTFGYGCHVISDNKFGVDFDDQETYERLDMYLESGCFPFVKGQNDTLTEEELFVLTKKYYFKGFDVKQYIEETTTNIKNADIGEYAGIIDALSKYFENQTKIVNMIKKEKESESLDLLFFYLFWKMLVVYNGEFSDDSKIITFPVEFRPEEEDWMDAEYNEKLYSGLNVSAVLELAKRLYTIKAKNDIAVRIHTNNIVPVFVEDSIYDNEWASNKTNTLIMKNVKKSLVDNIANSIKNQISTILKFYCNSSVDTRYHFTIKESTAVNVEIEISFVSRELCGIVREKCRNYQERYTENNTKIDVTIYLDYYRSFNGVKAREERKSLEKKTHSRTSPAEVMQELYNTYISSKQKRITDDYQMSRYMIAQEKASALEKMKTASAEEKAELQEIIERLNRKERANEVATYTSLLKMYIENYNRNPNLLKYKSKIASTYKLGQERGYEFPFGREEEEKVKALIESMNVVRKKRNTVNFANFTTIGGSTATKEQERAPSPVIISTERSDWANRAAAVPAPAPQITATSTNYKEMFEGFDDGDNDDEAQIEETEFDVDENGESIIRTKRSVLKRKPVTEGAAVVEKKLVVSGVREGQSIGFASSSSPIKATSANNAVSLDQIMKSEESSVQRDAPKTGTPNLLRKEDAENERTNMIRDLLMRYNDSYYATERREMSAILDLL